MGNLSEGIESAPWRDTLFPLLWNNRDVWFRKAFIQQKSPYAHSIWIDLDCEVKKDVSSLFEMIQVGDGFAISYTSDESLENLNRCTAISGGKKQMVKKKKCRFDNSSSSSSSSDDESFATRKLRIAQRKKKSAARTTKTKSKMHKKKKVNKNYIDLMDSDNDDGGADIGKRKKKYRHNEIPSCIELIDSDGEADHEHKDLNKKKYI